MDKRCCPQCGALMKGWKLPAHQKNIHDVYPGSGKLEVPLTMLPVKPNVYEFTCGKCNLGFHTLPAFRNHNKMEHTAAELLLCPVCNVQLHSEFEWTLHIDEHMEAEDALQATIQSNYGDFLTKHP